MSEQQPKRPYERPTLEAKDVFGAEALATCCRSTAATCSAGARSTFGKTARTSAVS